MSNKEYIRLSIKGMHCHSCELLIEEKLKEIAHVKSANINYKTGEAIIHYSNSAPDDQLINKAIVEAGYEIGQPEKLSFVTRDKREYIDLGIAFLFLTALYLVLKSLGLTSINLTPNLSSPSWGLIVVIGLVAGFSTCMALIGGLSLGLSAKFAENHPTATAAEKFRPHIFFVMGRILSYTLLGAILGLLGKAFQLSATVNGILTLFVGVVMLIMGLQLINIFPRLNRLKLALPKSIGKKFGLSQKHREYSHKQAMLMGGLTFFLPCGFTQAMQLYAISTGNFIFGALVMGLFALGTAPGLLGVGGITSLVRGSFKKRFFKVAGLAVISFALFNLNNGYTLASLNVGGSGQGKAVNDPNVVMENGIQVVKMTENNGGYSPNKFSIKKGVPVKWIIDVKAPYSCASSIVIPKLGIQKSLKAGENIIEFTPDTVGKLPFSCSMGMYTGVFNVYDGDGQQDDFSAAATVPISRGSSCGGGGGGCGGCGGGRKAPVDTNSQAVTAETSQDTVSQESIQVIKAIYTDAKFLSPSSFKVKAGTKVRLEVDVRDNGYGCGYAMTIPGLYNSAKTLKAGVPITMEFTPATPGTYEITCSMNMIVFGKIIVE